MATSVVRPHAFSRNVLLPSPLSLPKQSSQTQTYKERQRALLTGNEESQTLVSAASGLGKRFHLQQTNGC